jgi:hypothetical protein
MGNPQVPQQFEEVRARLAAEDPLLVLDRQHVDLVDVQKMAARRCQIPSDFESTREDRHGGGRRRSSR